MYRSPGIYLRTEENPGKPQLEDCLMKTVWPVITSNGSFTSKWCWYNCTACQVGRKKEMMEGFVLYAKKSKSFMLIWQCYLFLFTFLANGHLLRVSCQICNICYTYGMVYIGISLIRGFYMKAAYWKIIVNEHLAFRLTIFSLSKNVFSLNDKIAIYSWSVWSQIFNNNFIIVILFYM